MNTVMRNVVLERTVYSFSVQISFGERGQIIGPYRIHKEEYTFRQERYPRKSTEGVLLQNWRSRAYTRLHGYHRHKWPYITNKAGPFAQSYSCLRLVGLTGTETGDA
jgi:hypothetical protein